jgi:Na+/melibiose symporter-like transporter
MIAAIFAQSGVQHMYRSLGGSTHAKGFSIIMGGVALLSVLIAVFQMIYIKERYVVEVNKDNKSSSLKEMVIAVFTNKTAIIVYMYTIATHLANGIRSATTIYYFKYYFHNEGLLVVIGLISLPPILIGTILSLKATKILGIKGNLFTSAIVSIVTMSAIMLVPATSEGIVIYMILTVVGSFFTGLSAPAQGTMMPAAMDYTEWKYGLNINGFMSSLQGFLQTLATALAGSIAAGALNYIGYIKGVEQSNTVIFGLKILMSILPAFIMLLTVCVVWFDLTEDKQAKITKELAERRKN